MNVANNQPLYGASALAPTTADHPAVPFRGNILMYAAKVFMECGDITSLVLKSQVDTLSGDNDARKFLAKTASYLTDFNTLTDNDFTGTKSIYTPPDFIPKEPVDKESDQQKKDREADNEAHTVYHGGTKPKNLEELNAYWNKSESPDGVHVIYPNRDSAAGKMMNGLVTSLIGLPGSPWHLESPGILTHGEALDLAKAFDLNIKTTVAKINDLDDDISVFPGSDNTRFVTVSTDGKTTDNKHLLGVIAKMGTMNTAAERSTATLQASINSSAGTYNKLMEMVGTMQKSWQDAWADFNRKL